MGTVGGGGLDCQICDMLVSSVCQRERERERERERGDFNSCIPPWAPGCSGEGEREKERR
jgi:hypothetical protein